MKLLQLFKRKGANVNDDRKRQVATRKARGGDEVFSDMGKKRMAGMTPEERSEFSRRAINKRHHPDWFDKDGKQIKFKESK